MSGDWWGTLWTLLVTFCVVIIKCTESFWSPCICWYWLLFLFSSPPPALDAHIIDLPSITFSHYSHILTIRCKEHTYHFTINYNAFPLLLSVPDSNSATLYAARLKQYPLTFFYQTYHGYGAHGGTVGWDTVLQAGRPRVRFPMVSLEFFHWHNPSGRTMTLGLTQPLTEMSTRNISWEVKAAGA